MRTSFEPRYELIPEWEFYASAAETEYLQCIDEGLCVEEYKDLFDFTYRLPQSEIKQKLGEVLFDIVSMAKTVENYPYNEPSEPEAIRALCKPSKRSFSVPDRETVYDKIHGAWLGRVCGCMLGKSVEGVRTPACILF